MRTIKWLLATLAVLTFTSSGVQAATLTGDTIGQSHPLAVTSIVVGSGVDYTIGFVQINYDAGALGDHLVINISSTATFSGIFQSSGTSTLTLSGLNFSGGETLIGFTVLSSPIYPITVNILNSSSLSLSWTEGPSFSGGGIFLDGQFVTSASPVPLPAALPLFATVLAGGGLIAWRRKRKAASSLPSSI
jgi:hypothetical protein